MATFQHLADQPAMARLIKALVALLLLLVGWRIAKTLADAERRFLLGERIDATYAQVLRNATYGILLALVAIYGLELAGFPITSLLTLFGAMTLAVGLALKDSLSNVAAGVILIVLRPFRTGDRVLLAGQEGIVEGGFVFQTQLRAKDNRLIFLMNSVVLANPIVNYSLCDQQMLTVSVSLKKGADLNHALQVASTTLGADTRIAANPPLELSLSGGPSAELIVRAWAYDSPTDALRSELRSRLQNALDAIPAAS